MGSEYEVQRLGTVAKVRSGYAFKSNDMGSVGLPIIKIKNVVPPTVEITDCERVPESVIESIPNVERFELKEGDTLIAMTGATVGKVGKFPRSSERFFLNQRVGKVYLSEPTLADENYIYYIISKDTYVRQMFGIADGSAQANISGSQIESLEIPLPPLHIQRRIADILGTLDDKIELNRRMNATLEDMARTLFKSWFVDFDPVRAKMEGRQPEGMDAETATLFPDGFEDSELGEVPRGWGVESLGSLIEVIKGKSYRGYELSDSSTALVTLKSFHRGGGYREDGLKPYTGDFKQSQKLEAGDLIIAYTDVTQAAEVIGKPAIVRSDEKFDTLVASLDLGIVRPVSNRVSIPFLYCMFLGDDFQAHAYSHATGTTVLHLSSTALPSYNYMIPVKEVASLFERTAAPLFRQIDENSKQSRTLAALRDTLLPKLMGGEIQIVNLIN